MKTFCFNDVLSPGCFASVNFSKYWVGGTTRSKWVVHRFPYFNGLARCLIGESVDGGAKLFAKSGSECPNRETLGVAA